MVSYAMLPGAYRNQAGFEPGAPGTRTRLLSEGDTAAQPHATCRGVAALEPRRPSWDGRAPIRSTTTCRSRRTQPDSRTTRPSGSRTCWRSPASTSRRSTRRPDRGMLPGLGGTYVPADETQSTVASLASGSTHPLEEEIARARGRERRAARTRSPRSRTAERQAASEAQVAPRADGARPKSLQIDKASASSTVSGRSGRHVRSS